MVHSEIAHIAQVHFYGSLASGLAFSLIAIVGGLRLLDTVHRRGQRDRIAASICCIGAALIAAAVLRNAFIPLKPHHLGGLFIPISGAGAVLFLGGLLVSLLGVCLMPTGKAGKWLSGRKRSGAETEDTAWPPAPKRPK